MPAPEGYIFELFVRESVRGQGIGKQLLEVVKAEAQERRCSRLMLVNSRSRDSYKHKFYEGQGWKEREEIANNDINSFPFTLFFSLAGSLQNI